MHVFHLERKHKADPAGFVAVAVVWHLGRIRIVRSADWRVCFRTDAGVQRLGQSMIGTWPADGADCSGGGGCFLSSCR